MELHWSKTQVLLGMFYVLQSQTAGYCETSEKRSHTQISAQHKFLGFFAPVGLLPANIRPVASHALSMERVCLFCATSFLHYGDMGLPCIHTAMLPLVFPLDCAAACHLVWLCQGPTLQTSAWPHAQREPGARHVPQAITMLCCFFPPANAFL